jgi:hypothetical protein
MRRVIFLFIMLILASSFVYAGKSLPLDFYERESYLVTMYKGDRVFFEFDGENHSIILDEIKSNRVELDVFLYQDKKLKHQNPNYAFLDTERELRLDTNRDDIFDFIIKLNDFDPDKGLFEFTKVSIPKYANNIPVEEVDSAPEERENDIQEKFYQDKIFIGILGAIVLLLALIYLVDNYIRKKKGVYF